jgi:glutathione peroxidase-family protein
MKVTASENFKHYRNSVLGLDAKDFRALQSGKVVDVKNEIVKNFNAAFIEVKKLEATDGSTQSI